MVSKHCTLIYQEKCFAELTCSSLGLSYFKLLQLQRYTPDMRVRTTTVPLEVTQSVQLCQLNTIFWWL